MRTQLALLRNVHVQDLAEIVQTTADSRQAKERVWRYLESLSFGCPTEGCVHRPSELVFVCSGYETTHSYLELVDGGLNAQTKVGLPFVIDAFCRAQGSRGRCGNCKERNYCYRESAITTSIYCHGCGFFVDFPTRRVGYSSDFLFPPFNDQFRPIPG